MKNSWIFKRIFFAFVVVMLMMFAAAVMTHFILSVIEQASNRVDVARQAGAELLNAKSAHMLWMRNLQQMFIDGKLAPEPQAPTDCTFGRWYYSFTPDPEYADVYAKLEAPHARLHQIGHDIWELYRYGDTHRAMQIFNSQLMPLADEILALLTQVQQEVEAHGAAVAARAEQIRQWSEKGIWVLMVFGLLFAFGISFTTARTISRPIKTIASTAELVAGGDLTRLADPGKVKGEIATLTTAFNTMVAGLQEIVKTIREQALFAKEASESLSIASVESSRAGEQIAVTIQSVAENSTEMSSEITRIKQLAEELNQVSFEAKGLSDRALHVAEDTAESAERGNAALRASIEQLKTVSETVQFATDAIQNLGRRSEEIGDIVGLIDGIASQTNLLALNAAIEAARAGEQGRGFAVVAEEVRKLAAGSQDAAQKITNLIEDIMSETTVTTQSMEVNAEEVAKQLLAINQAAESLHEILVKADQTRAAAEDMTNIAAELTKHSQRLERLLQSIAQAVQDNAASSEEVAASSEEQNATAEEVAATAHQLKEIVEILTKSVNRFKV